MSRDFEQIGHKNLELLRYYVSNDIKRIDDKLEERDSSLLGYFVASVVDFAIASIFGDALKKVLTNTELSSKYCFVKLLQAHPFVSALGSLLLLVVLFVGVAFITKRIHLHRIQKAKESGVAEYKHKSEQYKTIDDFDNIACDGLLIAQSYKLKYTEESEEHIKKFYLYEMIHHLTKASRIVDKINQNKSFYISSDDQELIDSYRLDNFIEFYHKLVEFLNSKVSGSDSELIKDLVNLKSHSWDSEY